MSDVRLISVDDHVAISPDAVKLHLPRTLHEEFDHAVARMGTEAVANLGGKSFAVDTTWQHEAAGRPGYRDPVERLRDMDRDGVDAQVVYSELSAFRVFPRMREGRQVAARAFNETLNAFSSIDPKRLMVAYQLSLDDVPAAVKEVHRLAALGARVIHLPNYPSELGLPDYHERVYDPLWAAFSETGIPVHHHLGNSQGMWDLFRRDPTPQAGIYNAMNQMALGENIGFWILPGTLARFPELKVVIVESGLGWVPFYLATLDRRARGAFDFPELKELPSFYFHRQMYLTFFDDELGLRLRHELGVENILWSSDYPHPDTTWPHSREVIERQFAGVPADERTKILSGNARRLYGL
jgi:predicted TIM-barrel fold metal-dependent hydrolase